MTKRRRVSRATRAKIAQGLRRYYRAQRAAARRRSQAAKRGAATRKARAAALVTKRPRTAKEKARIRKAVRRVEAEAEDLGQYEIEIAVHYEPGVKR